MELNAARILIVGATGPGAVAAVQLTQAGAGYVAVADGGAQDGFNRAEILAARLAMLRPDIHADPYPVPVGDANAVAIATGHDAIVDGTRDPGTARVLARAGADLGIPVVHAAGAAVVVTWPGRTACIACAAGALPGLDSPGAAFDGLAGAVLAADTELALAEEEPPAAVVRTLRLPPEVHATALRRDATCAVCAAVPEAAR